MHGLENSDGTTRRSSSVNSTWVFPYEASNNLTASKPMQRARQQRLRGLEPQLERTRRALERLLPSVACSESLERPSNSVNVLFVACVSKRIMSSLAKMIITSQVKCRVLSDCLLSLSSLLLSLSKSELTHKVCCCSRSIRCAGVSPYLVARIGMVQVITQSPPQIFKPLLRGSITWIASSSYFLQLSWNNDNLRRAPACS